MSMSASGGSDLGLGGTGHCNIAAGILATLAPAAMLKSRSEEELGGVLHPSAVLPPQSGADHRLNV